MGILHAIGLGIGIMVLRSLVPEIWSSLEHVVLSVLATLGTLADHMQAAASTGSFLPPTF